MKFPELTYAAEGDPAVKRFLIQLIERLAGRDYFVPIYEIWRRDYVGKDAPFIRPVLDLVDAELQVRSGIWPPVLKPDVPVIIVANHPFGIMDGLGALALAEDLGRPFRVLIHKDLVKVPEIQACSLPIDFTATRAAQLTNLATRKKALQLLGAGETIVVFPAGGVATSPTTFGRAVDLPWKLFTARMVQMSKAQVLPLYFEGQCSALFHFVSKFSTTLRMSMIINEFRKGVGKPLRVHVGPTIPHEVLQTKGDRKNLMDFLFACVHEMADQPLATIQERATRLPAWLRR